MRRARWAAVLLALAPASAGASPAQIGAAVLRLPLSAAVAAMGGTSAAVAGGVSSIGANPGGVMTTPAPELESTFHSGVLDDAAGFIGYAHPFKYGVPFGGIAYYNGGTVNIVSSGGGQSTRTAEEDFIGIGGLAIPLGGGLSAGALGKVFRFDLAQEATATGVALDGGVQWATPVPGLRLGGALQNVGADVKFESASDPLPLTIRAGAAYTIDAPAETSIIGTYYTGSHLTFAADGVQVRGETAYASAAGSFSIDMGPGSSIAVRVGWTFDPLAATGLSYGIGLREKGFAVDYAQTEAGELGNVQYVSLSMRF